MSLPDRCSQPRRSGELCEVCWPTRREIARLRRGRRPERQFFWRFDQRPGRGWSDSTEARGQAVPPLRRQSRLVLPLHLNRQQNISLSAVELFRVEYFGGRSVVGSERGARELSSKATYCRAVMNDVPGYPRVNLRQFGQSSVPVTAAREILLRSSDGSSARPRRRTAARRADLGSLRQSPVRTSQHDGATNRSQRSAECGWVDRNPFRSRVQRFDAAE
jgi:hypothetical protein